ncbi:MAG: hypothetical protein KDA35_08075 [Hyphomonadaceae bacterium]|nr:hypothetical protein [Hyphomonadaceae bacterium]
MSADAIKQVRAAIAGGDHRLAEQLARSLVAEDATAERYEVLASVLRAQDRLEEALAAVDQALALDAGHIVALHTRAFILSRLGRYVEALGIYDALLARGVVQPQVSLNRSVALLGMTRDADAEISLTEAIERWPQDVGLQHMLASLRWMRGAGSDFARDFEVAVRSRPDALQLRIALADLLRRADMHAQAEMVLREGLARTPTNEAIQGSLGVVLDEMDRTGEALPFLRSALLAAPSSLPTRGNVVSALLRLGRADEALRELGVLRRAQPLNGDWIAYEAMAYRQLGSPLYHDLCDYDLMVQPFMLEPPRGFSSIGEFNSALKEVLQGLHVLETHPLDQSLRNGSQTTRSLLTLDHPIIKLYLEALNEPIRAYIATMKKPHHPWSGRKSQSFKLSGCWSVKLKPSGYHVNHLHPEGWISSAYYVSLPEVTKAGAGHEGWIKFGEPRWPTPGCSVERIVQPEEGKLVLFPSYMWHGTIPFSQGERMTAPFDVIPL